MGTNPVRDGLADALFGASRRAVLALLYGRTGEAFYVRQLVRAAGVGQGAVQRELKRLAEAGIVLRTTRGRHVYYQANPQCPIFAELRGLMIKTAGLADLVRAALVPLAEHIGVAFVYGSLARAEATAASDVDVMVVGDMAFGAVAEALGTVEAQLGREVNATVYPPEEFREKLRSGHHFLKAVLGEPKLYLIGDDRELDRLGQEGLDSDTPHQPARNRRSIRRGRPRHR